MATTEEAFNEAAERIKTLDGGKTSNEEKLKLYGLYKQITLGDNTTSKPGMLNLSAKAKWNAWDALKGKDKEEAMAEYIAEVDRQMAAYA